MTQLSPPVDFAFPAPALGTLTLWQRIRRGRANMLDVFPAEAYRQTQLQVRFLGRTYHYLTTPEAIDHAFMRHAERYERDPLGRRVLEPFAGEGLLMAEGEAWRAQRRTLAPAFQPRHIDGLIAGFDRVAAATIEGWGATGGNAAPLRRNLYRDFRHLALAAAARALFSIEDAPGAAALEAMMADYVRAAGVLRMVDYAAATLRLPLPQTAARRRFRRRFTLWVGVFLERRDAGAATDGKDLLDLIRAARDPETGAAFPPELVIDQIGTMLVAGFETTALALFWCAVLLARFPSWQARVRRDLVCEDGAGAPGPALLREAVTARAFVMEALRLFPPAYATLRRARVADEIAGVEIRRGDSVCIIPWIIHRHAKYWRDPQLFDPTRFIAGGAIATPRHWLPFGVGPRICIGMSFALSEILVVLRALLARHEVSLPDGRLPQPVGRFTLLPDHEPTFDLHAL